MTLIKVFRNTGCYSEAAGREPAVRAARCRSSCGLRGTVSLGHDQGISPLDFVLFSNFLNIFTSLQNLKYCTSLNGTQKNVK
jgi:hypothetical protein